MPIRIRVPGSVPGFDQTHPAAAITRFSGVAFNGGFLNLITGQPLTTSGTPTAGTDVYMGPRITYSTSDVHTLAGQSTANDLQFTLAGIVTPLGVGCSFFQSSGTNVGLQLDNSGSGFLRWSAAGVTGSTSTLSLTTGAPYFVAASGITGTVDFVVRRLDVPVISNATNTPTFTPSAPNGTYRVGNGATGTAGNARISAFMFSGRKLPLATLLQWAANPWSFWYQRK